MFSYPPVNFYFKVDFQTPQVSQSDNFFSKVSGLSTEVAMEKVKEGGENRFIHRLPTQVSYPNLILSRGLMMNSSLVTWIEKAVDNFEFEPGRVQISLLNEEATPLVTWDCVNVLPIKWSGAEFDAQNGEIFIETIELSYNYFQKIK